MKSTGEMRSILQSADWHNDPFSVLSEIANTCAIDVQLGREYVIRVLACRSDLPNGTDEILDELAICVGLYPYVEELETLSLRSAIAHASHRADGEMEDFVLHQAQSNVLRMLLAGESIILSAPTSFGKSLLVDIIIAAKNYDNAVIIVPTLALVEETRRRMGRFASTHAIITANDQRPTDKNIFVLTQERFLAMEIPKIDFFVIDEFYKISISDDGARATQLNHAFLRLLQSGAQFYLLGPSIGSIPEVVKKRTNCTFLVENFHTVALEIHLVDKKPSKEDALANLLDQIEGQTIIYCQSPASTRKLLRSYLELREIPETEDEELLEAAEWTADSYHDEWLVSVALAHGIGIHHGRLPRSLGRFMIRAFEDGKLKILLCTSTLIEGVNTSAKNVIVYDSKLNKRPLEFFTFNNIKGRAGRMFRHFVGHIYLFEKPPEPELPFVDFPSLNPTENTPSSLLLQIPAVDLPEKLRSKVEELLNQDLLPLEFLKRYSGIEPEYLIETAKILFEKSHRELMDFAWSNRPEYDGIKITSALIWNELGGAASARQSGLRTANMMTLWIWELYKTRSVPKFRPKMIKSQIDFGIAPDDAVENVLAFLRGWAAFNYPKYLIALSDIVNIVLTKRGIGKCDYVPFATAIEHFFQPSSFSSLEEYGLPFEISQKLLERKLFSRDDNFDRVLTSLKRRELDQYADNAFEKRVIEDFQQGLGLRKIRQRNET